MKLNPDQYFLAKQSALPRVFWWVTYLFGAVWMQEISGGRDFFSPGVLICLQMRQWSDAVALAMLYIFLHEGVGTLTFGSSLFFYIGIFVLFFTLNWWLDPQSFLFMFCFSLCLAGWLYIVLVGAISFQELVVQMPDFDSGILSQGAIYMLTWIVALALYRRMVGRGRI